MASFSERLKDLRENSCLTQPDLVNKLKSYNINTSAQNISYWEKGRQPSFEILIALSNVFDVSVDYLIGKSDFKSYEQESYFTEDEKIFLSTINYIDSKIIINRVTREIESFKSSLLNLFTQNDFSMKIVLSFIKSVTLLYTIYLAFSSKTDTFINNLNNSMLSDKTVSPEEVNSRKHILQILHTRLSELDTPTYNFSNDLSRIIEELFTLKNDMELVTSEASISNLLMHIEASSEKINLSLLDEIRKDYLGDLND